MEKIRNKVLIGLIIIMVMTIGEALIVDHFTLGYVLFKFNVDWMTFGIDALVASATLVWVIPDVRKRFGKKSDHVVINV